MKVKGRLVFHNVGQGMFYSGDLSVTQANPSQPKSFRFVYDCGAHPRNRYLKTAIERYHNDCAGKPEIDMLILSHLHRDHVSGVDRLLKKFQVGWVLLPYLPPLARLFLAVLQHSARTPIWYFSFLKDPVGFLLERGVGKVVLIGGGGEGSRREDEDMPPPEPFMGEGDLIQDRLSDDPDLRGRIASQDPEWETYLKKGHLLAKSQHGYLLALRLWVFRFFTCPVSDQDLREFRECVKQLPCPDPRACIMDPDHRRKLRQCYEGKLRSLGSRPSERLNNASLVVYHAPLQNKFSVLSTWCLVSPAFCPFPIRPWRCHFGEDSRFGHLLMGDLDLNRCFQDLTHRFGTLLGNVCVASLPHHGAWSNWNEDILQETDCPLWVVSAGLGNPYGHPSLRVLESIMDHDCCVCWSSELAPLVIEQEVGW